ncbi:MAG: hypothetical protein M1602_00970, partial [Firmicutes bacterium]|nr:hypothetical protein [Bacillota bacterium]
AVRALALAEFKQGNAPVLMTSWGGLEGLAPSLVERVALADPPLSQAGYAAASRLAALPQGLVWHWSDEGLAFSESLAAAHCPGREELARLYLHLKSLVHSGQAITTLAAAASDLPVATIRAGFQVLTELGLLAPPRDGEAWTWLPAGGSRLALDASPSFRRSQARKQEFQKALGYFKKVASA